LIKIVQSFFSHFSPLSKCQPIGIGFFDKNKYFQAIRHSSAQQVFGGFVLFFSIGGIFLFSRSFPRFCAKKATGGGGLSTRSISSVSARQVAGQSLVSLFCGPEIRGKFRSCQMPIFKGNIEFLRVFVF
jgi:hypothetical protein